MPNDDAEQLTGELRTEAGELIAEQLSVELDKEGGVQVALFELPITAVSEDQGLQFHVAGGRTLDLYIIEGGIQPDGLIRAAVVKDSGQPRYGLGLEHGLNLEPFPE